MRHLERGPSSGPALSRDDPLAVFNHLQLYAGPRGLWAITLQPAAKASGAMCTSTAVFVFDKFSAREIHVLWSLFLMLQALIREAFLEGEN